MSEFEEWLVNLDAETLTDELKDEILEHVAELQKDSYSEGYEEGYAQAKDDIIRKIATDL